MPEPFQAGYEDSPEMAAQIKKDREAYRKRQAARNSKLPPSRKASPAMLKAHREFWIESEKKGPQYSTRSELMPIVGSPVSHMPPKKTSKE